MLVIGMNRLRHAYLALAPELEPYFITAHHDDHAAILQTYGAGYRYSVGRVLGARRPWWRSSTWSWLGWSRPWPPRALA
jgi:hypothetical protein